MGTIHSSRPRGIPCDRQRGCQRAEREVRGHEPALCDSAAPIQQLRGGAPREDGRGASPFAPSPFVRVASRHTAPSAPSPAALSQVLTWQRPPCGPRLRAHRVYVLTPARHPLPRQGASLARACAWAGAAVRRPFLATRVYSVLLGAAIERPAAWTPWTVSARATAAAVPVRRSARATRSPGALRRHAQHRDAVRVEGGEANVARPQQ
jgi:hypothetical protein